MEIDEKLKIGIGTKEPERLKPAKVKVLTIDISKPKDKEGNIIKDKSGKEYDDKVTFGCKHPDKEETIELSKVRYLRNDKVTESGLWFKQDTDGLLPKNSATSIMLRHYGAQVLADMRQKELETVAGDDGFLCIKAY